jgi:hypothetical protein
MLLRCSHQKHFRNPQGLPLPRKKICCLERQQRACLKARCLKPSFKTLFNSMMPCYSGRVPRSKFHRLRQRSRRSLELERVRPAASRYRVDASYASIARPPNSNLPKTRVLRHLPFWLDWKRRKQGSNIGLFRTDICWGPSQWLQPLCWCYCFTGNSLSPNPAVGLTRWNRSVCPALASWVRHLLRFVARPGTPAYNQPIPLSVRGVFGHD